MSTSPAVAEKDLGLIESAEFIEKQLINIHAVLDEILNVDTPSINSPESVGSSLLNKLDATLRTDRNLVSILLNRLSILKEKF